MDTPHRAKHPGTFKILANLNLSDNFKGPTLGPHHIVQGTVADVLTVLTPSDLTKDIFKASELGL